VFAFCAGENVVRKKKYKNGGIEMSLGKIPREGSTGDGRRRTVRVGNISATVGKIYNTTTRIYGRTSTEVRNRS